MRVDKHKISLLVEEKKKLTVEKAIHSLLVKNGLPLEDITKEPSGRPYLSNAAQLGWDISISHSTKYIAVALGYQVKIGIDCEEVLPLEITPFLLDLILTPEEKLNWDPQGNLQIFYEIWTAKEAISKSLGLGLQLPFEQLNLKDIEGSLEKLSLTKKGTKVSCELIPSLPEVVMSLAVIYEENRA